MEHTFITKLKNIDTIIDRYDDITGSITGTLRAENCINTPEKMDEEIQKISETGRLLSIGIIGRVKAGKSSLLNALFFGGKQVLPKAATPMTAALTVITYDEKPHAEIEFFTKADISALEKEHADYTALQAKLLEQETQKEEEQQKKKNIPIDRLRIERKVKKELENNPKEASYDQYERMKKSGKLSGFVNGEKAENQLTVADMSNLDKFVSADGEFMPFTKSVQLFMNIEELKDIQIVDTPGMNDPIKSREKRTEDYLGQCDVVFVVSPAGDFLSEEDLTLMGHASGKKGVNQVYLIASRSDQQLYGDEKENSNGILPNVIKSIRSQLAQHAKEVFEDKKSANPECREMYQMLIDDIQNRVLITSSISHSMDILFEEQNSWDEDMKYAWNLYKEDYPDFFSGSSSRESLKMIAGVTSVKQNIDAVRKIKDSIMEKRQQEYESKQLQNVDSYLNSVKKALQENKLRLQETDAAQLIQQKAGKEKIRNFAALSVDDAFDDSIYAFKTMLSTTLKQNSRGLFDSASDFSSYEKSETKTRTGSREKRGFFSGVARFFGLGGYEDYTYTETVRTLQTAAVKRQLNDLVLSLEEDLTESAEKAVMDWRGTVQSKTISALRSAVEDDDLVDIALLKMCIRKVIGNLTIPEFKLSSVKFGDSYSGVIKDEAIDAFINEADEYLSNLRSTYSSQIKSFLSNMEKSAKNETMSSLLFSNMDKELEELEQNIKNKKSMLMRYSSCLDELSKIA